MSNWGDVADIAGIVAECESLRRQLRERDERIATLEVKLRGANERVGLLFDAKNHWADRARTARRAAAARLRAVKRMKQAAKDWRDLSDLWEERCHQMHR